MRPGGEVTASVPPRSVRRTAAVAPPAQPEPQPLPPVAAVSIPSPASAGAPSSLQGPRWRAGAWMVCRRMAAGNRRRSRRSPFRHPHVCPVRGWRQDAGDRRNQRERARQGADRKNSGPKFRVGKTTESFWMSKAITIIVWLLVSLCVLAIVTMPVSLQTHLVATAISLILLATIKSFNGQGPGVW